ncbi:MAG: malate dehydrogenase [Candidatus Lindowbacteria bacterium RIFCSPLOWO2_12_FULL_62_27]|nr:MAG: malate dehydrogenase [Candidatus Lindowbacteria bacterium RIFCSPLOWO2_12_FULL_62_27]OGH63387.1 MAG: malate dehydrogenase [Candidatus Lindowbacteria bacterium RIFCSPLOWO2_02_FULL_62_12]
MRRRKITVVGAGNVGASAALYLAERELGDVALVDVVEGIPEGKGLDLLQYGPVGRFDSRVTGSQDSRLMEGSDVVVVTAGVARKPGMTRLDLLQTNARIIQSVAKNIQAHAPDAIVIVITNPLDVMTYLLWKLTGFPAHRVVGQAGVLDGARFSAFIAQELDVSVEDISTLVLGGHGDDMVPLVRYTTVSGIPLADLLPADRITALVDRARNGGAEIVKLLKTGSAYYAPAASGVQMVEAVVKDKKRILACSAHLSGQYGLSDVYIGVPVVLGGGGVEKIIELKLTDAERAALHNSAKIYKEAIADALKVVA